MRLSIHMPTFQNDALHCPLCGCEYLHHDTVDVFNRREDAASGQHTQVPSGTDGVVMVRTALDGNPSQRRSGVRIAFSCESCTSRVSLCLVQHKGASYLYWDPDPRSAPRPVR